jgi:hypothetical protein
MVAVVLSPVSRRLQGIFLHALNLVISEVALELFDVVRLLVEHVVNALS